MVHNNQYPQTAETLPHLGLGEGMNTFEGTPLVPLIRDALTEAGIDPHGYTTGSRHGLNPGEFATNHHDHYDYHGLPATSENPGSFGLEPSPIVEKIDAEIDAGTMLAEKVSGETVQFAPDAPHTEKLLPYGMLALKDAQSGTTLAYAARLGADGGREGYVILSTNSVVEGTGLQNQA